MAKGKFRGRRGKPKTHPANITGAATPRSDINIVTYSFGPKRGEWVTPDPSGLCENCGGQCEPECGKHKMGCVYGGADAELGAWMYNVECPLFHGDTKERPYNLQPLALALKTASEYVIKNISHPGLDLAQVLLALTRASVLIETSPVLARREMGLFLVRVRGDDIAKWGHRTDEDAPVYCMLYALDSNDARAKAKELFDTHYIAGMGGCFSIELCLDYMSWLRTDGYVFLRLSDTW